MSLAKLPAPPPYAHVGTRDFSTIYSFTVTSPCLYLYEGVDNRAAHVHRTRKKMVAVYFISIPCEPNTANRHIDDSKFWDIRPCANNIVYARFEGLKLLGLSYAKNYG